ncbi:hypothetical protein Bhyg_12476 [Pseudolycoriella hygida]|uniref:Uncharacterized protein n=1 Tax=Pseudolycoriella hygida TaxID=35572 RepID=A0A9Q0MYX7_9DIPT|nr:hypothetical protein Bhyg_12476 [Pseudolycoriella hygida]
MNTSKGAASAIRNASSGVFKVKNCWYIFILLALLIEISSAARVCDLQPITNRISYHTKARMCLDWSHSGGREDYSRVFEVIDFAKQNITGNYYEFVKMYPTASITMSGEAVSMATFGKRQFSDQGISTRKFDEEQFRDEALIYVTLVDMQGA